MAFSSCRRDPKPLRAMTFWMRSETSSVANNLLFFLFNFVVLSRVQA